MRRTIFVVLLLCCVPALTFASHFGDFHVIPGAGRGPGAAGSMWQTDIIIHNFLTTPLTVEIGLVESGLGQADNFFPVMINGGATVTIPAGATRSLTDVLRNHRGRDSAMGALLIGGDHPFAVTSRIYNVDSSGATIGQTVPVTQEFLSGTAQRGVIPGIIANTNFRSNIGFVAAASTGAPLVVEVAITDAAGGALGATSFTIPAGTIAHVQVSSAAITTTPFDLATATIRILSGSGDVAGYASVVDNRSNHAAFAGSGFSGSAMSATKSTLATFLEVLRERRNRVRTSPEP
jgi:hypothetical protein